MGLLSRFEPVNLWFGPRTAVSFKRRQPLPPVDQATLLIGVAERDITPEVPLPRFGYSSLAVDGQGAATPLKVRAFYLKPVSGEPFVLVQADLGASSLLFQHGIAERVAASTDIALNNITVNVTHTHSGPGNFLESDFYNAFGSNRPGFDPAVYDFILTQMTEAVLEAYQSRSEGRVGVGRTEVYGLTRNRSLAAWLRNDNVHDKSECEGREFEAVNPTLTLVRLDRRNESGKFLPAGAFSFFSIHGTAIPREFPSYHADVWYRMETVLEDRATEYYGTSARVIHGPVQATMGDNTPDWKEGERGPKAAERIGTALGEKAWELFRALDERMTEDLVISSGLQITDLFQLNEAERCGTDRRAIIGAAVAGAAKGDEVIPFSYIHPFAPLHPRRFFTAGPQGEKQWMLSKLQLQVLPSEIFPHLVSVHVARLNDLYVVSLPIEVSFESGNRFEREVRRAVGRDDIHVVIASHANGYMGYVTTPEEYSAQCYEGGHTLYGKMTQRLFSSLIHAAADRIRSGNFLEAPEALDFNLRTANYLEKRGGRI